MENILEIIKLNENENLICKAIYPGRKDRFCIIKIFTNSAKSIEIGWIDCDFNKNGTIISYNSLYYDDPNNDLNLRLSAAEISDNVILRLYREYNRLTNMCDTTCGSIKLH